MNIEQLEDRRLFTVVVTVNTPNGQLVAQGDNSAETVQLTIFANKNVTLNGVIYGAHNSVTLDTAGGNDNVTIWKSSTPIVSMVAITGFGDDEINTLGPGIEISAGAGEDNITCNDNMNGIVEGDEDSDYIYIGQNASAIAVWGGQGYDTIDARAVTSITNPTSHTDYSPYISTGERGFEGSATIGTGGGIIYGSPFSDILHGSTGTDEIYGFNGDDSCDIAGDVAYHDYFDGGNHVEGDTAVYDNNIDTVVNINP